MLYKLESDPGKTLFAVVAAAQERALEFERACVHSNRRGSEQHYVIQTPMPPWIRPCTTENTRSLANAGVPLCRSAESADSAG